MDDKERRRENAMISLLAFTMANFSAISFGVGIYEKENLALILGLYSLGFALMLIWRATE